MKKIGILTYHAAPNYGAVLQTFAQVAYHESMTNRCYIINHVPRSFGVPYRSWIKEVITFNFPVAFRSILFFFKFHQFRRKHFCYDGPSFHSADDIKRRTMDYDVVSVGSDQVWNPTWFFRGTYAWVYFLSFVPAGVRKVAIAASSGGAAFPLDQIPSVTADLKRFARVGVREKDTVDFIRSVGINAEHDFDPVFLLDKYEWTSFAQKDSRLHLKNAVFLFFLHDEVPSHLERVLGSFPRGTVFYTASNASTWVRDSRIKIRVLSPNAWVDAIHTSQFVITNSFHAVAFCLILNKSFLAVRRQGAMSGMNNRISSLLEEVALLNHFVSDLSAFPSVPFISSQMWEKINEIVGRRRETLRNVLARI